MRKTSLVLAALLAVVGVCVMLWPVFTGHRLQADTDAAVQEFLAERNEPEQQYPELLAELQKYNRQLYAEKQCNLTDLEACEEPAADLSAYGIEDEIIGVLEIPAMELKSIGAFLRQCHSRQPAVRTATRVCGVLKMALILRARIGFDAIICKNARQPRVYKAFGTRSSIDRRCDPWRKNGGIRSGCRTMFGRRWMHSTSWIIAPPATSS